MARTNKTITINDFEPGSMTLTVKLSRSLRLRVWLGVWIIKLGCRVVGIDYNQEPSHAD